MKEMLEKIYVPLFQEDGLKTLPHIDPEKLAQVLSDMEKRIEKLETAKKVDDAIADFKKIAAKPTQEEKECKHAWTEEWPCECRKTKPTNGDNKITKIK